MTLEEILSVYPNDVGNLGGHGIDFPSEQHLKIDDIGVLFYYPCKYPCLDDLDHLLMISRPDTVYSVIS